VAVLVEEDCHGGRARTSLPQDLADGRSQFQAWRARRTVGRIPQTLWTLAVRLRSQHGVNRTAAALGLDYSRLKKQAQDTADAAPTNGPAFIELPSPMMVGKQAVVDFHQGAGATLRVHLMGYDAVEVAALARHLVSAE
jgi:hypothetical protein